MNSAAHIATIIIMLAGASTAAADLVERRGSEPSVEGSVDAVDESGVSIRSGTGARIVIPWDRIRSVDAPVFVKQIQEHRQRAVELWRARSRVERRDTALAEPLLERLFEHFRGHSNESALVVAEGLLRCRLARGEQTLAVIPALETARLRHVGMTTGSYTSLEKVIDEATWLCPLVPPVFIATPHLQRLQQELAAYDAQGDAVITAIAAQYRRAAALASGAAPQPPAASSGSAPQPGVDLLHDLLACCQGSPTDRRAAADRLARQLPALPPWAEPWARYHLGLALLAEPEREQRQRGLVSLLQVPARFTDTQPYLAGLALFEAAAALQRDGEADAAATLRAELDRHFPDHPVRLTLPQNLPAAAPRASAGAAHKD